MIPDPKNPNAVPEAIVIDIISRKPRISMKELYGFFSTRYEPGMSLQGLYNLVHRLIDQRVLIKEDHVVSIDASWIYNVLNFTNTLQQTYFGQGAATATILLEEGEVNEYVFENVLSMDNFWWHALIVVVIYYATEQHADKNVYAYTDHCWFQLVRTPSEQTLNDAYKQHGMHLYHIGGQDTFLDQLTPQLIEDENVDVSIQHIKEFERNSYIVVIGDFIFETQLPNYIYEEIEKIYERVGTMADFDSKQFEYWLKQPARTTLQISRNKKRSSQLRKRIAQCF